MMVLPTAYMPPIEYFAIIAKYNSEVIIDIYENYQRQSYRNRCNIAAANGIQPLSLPIIKANGHHTLVKDVKLDYSKEWQRNHWGAIYSAYNNSPFFLYYKDELEEIFTAKFDLLIDLNNEITSFFLNKIKLNTTINFSESYIEKTTTDFREKIHPKKLSLNSSHPKYLQVFSDKSGFIPNLSIADALFNLGPDTKNYITSIFIDD